MARGSVIRSLRDDDGREHKRQPAATQRGRRAGAAAGAGAAPRGSTAALAAQRQEAQAAAAVCGSRNVPRGHVAAGDRAPYRVASIERAVLRASHHDRAVRKERPRVAEGPRALPGREHVAPVPAMHAAGGDRRAMVRQAPPIATDATRFTRPHARPCRRAVAPRRRPGARGALRPGGLDGTQHAAHAGDARTGAAARGCRSGKRRRHGRADVDDSRRGRAVRATFLAVHPHGHRQRRPTHRQGLASACCASAKTSTAGCRPVPSTSAGRGRTRHDARGRTPP